MSLSWNWQKCAHYSAKYRLLFTHIPKTGGSSIRQSGVLSCRPTYHIPAQDLSFRLPTSVRRRMTWFAVIRNPWARAVSGWYFFRYGSAPGSPLYRKENEIEHRRLSRWGDFAEFVRRVDTRQGIWWPQVRWICPRKHGRLGLPLVDKLLRTECLDEDWKKLVSAAGVPKEQWVLPRVNSVPHPPWRELYTAELRDIIAKKYARDIEMFGYRFHDDLPKNSSYFP